MKSMRIAATIFCTIAAALAAGCGLKPSPTVPSDLTVGRALVSVERRAAAIHDISGWGRARSTEGSSVRTAKVSVKFIRPNLFKSVILGFAGIELATVASDGDSLTAYIPAADGFIRTGLDAKALSAFLPLAGAGFGDLLPIMAGLPPIPASLETFTKELRRRGKNAELILSNGDSEYAYLLTGPDMRIIECRHAFRRESVWTVKWKNFENNGDTVFPKNVHITLARGEVGFEWSSYTLNSGLDKASCALSVPHDARRLFPRPSGR
jgi:hypothetical protein